MKKLLYASLALAAMASCQKESFVDQDLINNQVMQFAPYAGASATKGSAIANNGDFQGNAQDGFGSFTVAAYQGGTNYFGFRGVTYNGSKWANDSKMYWPNEDCTLHFGAYYPTGAAGLSTEDGEAPSFSNDGTDNSLTMKYTVPAEVANQEDLMYAISNHVYTIPEDAEGKVDETAIANQTVGLHFKHALTQIAFTAKLDATAGIEVTVNSIKLCNIADNGVFTASADTKTYTGDFADQDKDDAVSAGKDLWAVTEPAAYTDGGTTNLENYTAPLNLEGDATSINVTTAGVTLTDAENVMMLLPQALNPWSATEANEGTESYLSINCTIKHTGGEAPIVSGNVYVPFSSADIVYGTAKEQEWLPGYKITYNLVFGGGFTIPNPEPNPDPEKPGETPDPEVVIPTLRDITYTVTVDDWKEVTAPDVVM